MNRRKNPEEIKRDALVMASRKAREGCGSCVQGYIQLAREHGATVEEVSRFGFLKQLGISAAAITAAGLLPSEVAQAAREENSTFRPFEEIIMATPAYQQYKALLPPDLEPMKWPTYQMLPEPRHMQISLIEALHRQPTYNVFTADMNLEGNTVGHTAGLIVDDSNAAAHTVQVVIDSLPLLAGTVTPDGMFVQAEAVWSGQHVDLSGKNYRDQGAAILFPQGSRYDMATQKVFPLTDPAIVHPNSLWDCLNQCFASFGIGGFLLSIIGSLCGIVCGAGQYNSCYTCVLLLGLVSGGIVGYCFLVC